MYSVHCCGVIKVILRVVPIPGYSNETATSSGRGLVQVTTPTDLYWRDVIKVPRTLRYVVAVRYEVSALLTYLLTYLSLCHQCCIDELDVGEFWSKFLDDVRMKDNIVVKTV